MTVTEALITPEIKRARDAINAVPAAACYNLRRLLMWVTSFVSQNSDRARPSCPGQIGLKTKRGWIPSARPRESFA